MRREEERDRSNNFKGISNTSSGHTNTQHTQHTHNTQNTYQHPHEYYARTEYFAIYSLMVENVYFVGREVVRMSNICIAKLKLEISVPSDPSSSSSPSPPSVAMENKTRNTPPGSTERRERERKGKREVK